jgi:hypothetical protein
MNFDSGRYAEVRALCTTRQGAHWWEAAWMHARRIEEPEQRALATEHVQGTFGEHLAQVQETGAPRHHGQLRAYHFTPEHFVQAQMIFKVMTRHLRDYAFYMQAAAKMGLGDKLLIESRGEDTARTTTRINSTRTLDLRGKGTPRYHDLHIPLIFKVPSVVCFLGTVNNLFAFDLHPDHIHVWANPYSYHTAHLAQEFERREGFKVSCLSEHEGAELPMPAVKYGTDLERHAKWSSSKCMLTERQILERAWLLHERHDHLWPEELVKRVLEMSYLDDERFEKWVGQ